MVCIAIPALVTSINGSEAVVEVGGQPRQVNISLTTEVNAGNYVLLRNGYATMVVSEQEALEIYQLLEEVSKANNDQYITSLAFDNTIA